MSDPDIDSASRPGHGPDDPAELQQGGTAAAVPASARGPQPLHGAAAIRAIAADIKLGHSIFALPFALLGAFLAAVAAGGPLAASAAGGDGDGDGRFRFAMQLALVIVAMVAARTAAMIANRLVDRAIDARNPRTAGRALPSGRVAAGTMWVAMLASIAATLAAAAGFRLIDGNPWPLYLAVPVLAWLLLYGYLKRFTWLCHLWLGISLGMSPVLAAVAVNPQALEGLAPWLLGAAVTCWVAGFDVIYALQDVEIDRREGLSSLPASWGEGRALHASRLLHIAATALLVGVYLVAPGGSLGRLYVGGVAIAGLVLLVEHLTVKRWGTSRLAITFGLLNGVVSIVVGGAGIADLLIS